MMGYGIQVELWGDYALFSRPELKVERVSYDCITPSAARGILEAVFWKPAIRYKIDRIRVLNEIKFTNIRRNEVSSKISARNVSAVMNGADNPLFISSSDDIQQRASMLLKDVHYLIDAHFELTDKAGEQDNADKFYAIITRRLRAGQCYHMPYFGCREFPVSFRLYEANEPPESFYIGQSRDLGLMLYDMDYSIPDDIQPMFFRASMRDGVIDLTDCEVFR